MWDIKNPNNRKINNTIKVGGEKVNYKLETVIGIGMGGASLRCFVGGGLSGRGSS